MIRLLICLLSLSFATGSFAHNDVKKIFDSVDSGVVELHVKALAPPKPGQVRYEVSTVNSLGSGALISDTGRILTAAHVVDKASEIEVIYKDGTKTSGHVVWVDSMIDLAMIQAAKVPSKPTVLKLAERGDFSVGEQVVVIGAPYGVSHSLSVGYLSGIRLKDEHKLVDITPKFLQTDAAINQGNSGGPMFNSKGEIIGIVSHILSQSGGNQGLGFVVSVDTIKDIIDSEPNNFSGFIPHALTKKQAYALNIPYGYGMLIQQVVPGTLADKLGFRGGDLSVTIGRRPIIVGGDVVVEIFGKSLNNLEAIKEIRKRLAKIEKGDKVVFKYIREGRQESVTWTVD